MILSSAHPKFEKIIGIIIHEYSRLTARVVSTMNKTVAQIQSILTVQEMTIFRRSVWIELFSGKMSKALNLDFDDYIILYLHLHGQSHSSSFDSTKILIRAFDYL